MTEPLISFVIATMNREKDLHRCLASIYQQRYGRFEVIVVDNGSTDGTSDMVRRDYADVRLFSLPENAGAAGGKTVGLKHAIGAFVVQLDDDEAFSDNIVCERVISYFEEYPEAGVLSFNILDPRTHQTAERTVPRRDKLMLYQDTLCAYFLGGGCAFKAEVLREVGYYWEMLNPYGSEEFDLSYRILEKGYSILWCKDIPIYHFESQVARPQGRRTYFETRNRPWVALRHLPWRHVLVNFAAWWGYGGLIALKSGTLSSYFRGVRDCIRGLPAVYEERKVVSESTIRILRKNSGPLYY